MYGGVRVSTIDRSGVLHSSDHHVHNTHRMQRPAIATAQSNQCKRFSLGLVDGCLQESAVCAKLFVSSWSVRTLVFAVNEWFPRSLK